MDGLPYSSLLYGNGPGYTSPRAIPSNNSEEEKNAVHGSAVPRQWATHGGEDVPVYAQVGTTEHVITHMLCTVYIGRSRSLQSISQCDVESHPKIFRNLTKLKRNQSVYNLMFNQVNVLGYYF